MINAFMQARQIGKLGEQVPECRIIQASGTSQIGDGEWNNHSTTLNQFVASQIVVASQKSRQEEDLR
ncbi:MAG: hypothetical protein U5J63_14710 [Fodinibius sp.]|nr:hypothetical protein [Fodinibius sp.]